jgi:hypothetical protein
MVQGVKLLPRAGQGDKRKHVQEKGRKVKYTNK